MQRTVYRNLNQAKRDLSVYVWSVALVKGSASRGKVQGHEWGTLTMANPAPYISLATLARIRAKHTREVGFWFYGDVVANGSIRGMKQRITMDPYKYDEWHYSKDLSLVNFRDVIGIEFTPTGAYAILRS